ncbi:MAG: ImmA/IrrE family metallo-endopeptidase [Bacillota bacterium]|nr:ImmA/IrrE family metallo-endopeptidase [Bacillota bacterium]
MRGCIKDKVKILIKKYKTEDPFIIADLLHIHVIEWPLHEEINGLYQYERREKFIYINSSLPDYVQKVICAHELGHAILHPKTNCTFLKNHTLFNINKYEKEANLFAIEMLISDEKIENYKEYSLQQIAAIEKVPLEILKLKFQNKI